MAMARKRQRRRSNKLRLVRAEITPRLARALGCLVALHLFKKHKIWTGDKVLINGLQSKGYDICVTTTELKTKMYKK
jgi:hypothetical protein